MKHLIKELQTFKEVVRVSMETLASKNVELKHYLRYILDLLRGFITEHKGNDAETLPKSTSVRLKLSKLKWKSRVMVHRHNMTVTSFTVLYSVRMLLRSF